MLSLGILQTLFKFICNIWFYFKILENLKYIWINFFLNNLKHVIRTRTKPAKVQIESEPKFINTLLSWNLYLRKLETWIDPNWTRTGTRTIIHHTSLYIYKYIYIYIYIYIYLFIYTNTNPLNIIYQVIFRSLLIYVITTFIFIRKNIS